MRDHDRRLRDALKRDPAQVMEATTSTQPQPQWPVYQDAEDDERLKYDPVPLIIEQVSQPVVPDRADRPEKKGVDLGPHEVSLRQLLADAHEFYEAALDDYETRADPNKPKCRLENNWDPNKPECAYDLRNYVDEEIDDGFGQTWEEFWDEHYYRSPGNPGHSRSKDLAVAPLHSIYTLVRHWWLQNIDPSGFRPTYPRRHHGAERRSQHDMPLYNPSGRLFLLIAQELETGYTADICYGVQETMRKRRQALARERRSRQVE